MDLTQSTLGGNSSARDEQWLVKYMQQVDEADDAIWILTSTFTIFTMQSGFGLLESGSVTSKNEVNIMVKNAVDVIIGGLSYLIFGYGFSFGNDTRFSNPFSGWGNFFLLCNEDEIGTIYPKFFFQASFSTTATTIVSGAMAERTKLEAYIIFSFLNTVIYCFPAHWCWAENGWLRRLGYVDIAGAGPVHLVGGLTGLVATMMLKPRHGRFRSKNPPSMGSPTNAVLGMFMLWWGWLGFNCGSTFGISAFKWKLAARSAISTFVSSVSGGTLAMFISYVMNSRRFDVTYMINGILGSLVSTTAYCALAEPWEGLVIGMVASCVVLLGMQLLSKLHIDDPVGVVPVHCMCGCWGLIASGLFCRKNLDTDSLNFPLPHHGLFTGGGFQLLGVQVIAIVSIGAWTIVTSYIVLKLVDITIGLRVSLKEELIGADVCEHGVGDIVFDKNTQYLIRKQPPNEHFDDPFSRRKSTSSAELLLSRNGSMASRRESFASEPRQSFESEIPADFSFLSENKDEPSKRMVRKRARYAQKKSAMFGRKKSDGDMYRILWRYGIARVLEDKINTYDKAKSDRIVKFANDPEMDQISGDDILHKKKRKAFSKSSTKRSIMKDRTSSTESECKLVPYDFMTDIEDMMQMSEETKGFLIRESNIMPKDFVRSEPNLSWQGSLESQYDD